MNTLKNLIWIEDYLHDEVIAEPMHDGIGYYWREKLVLIAVESSQSTVYRGVHYPFQIWNGCFFPVEKFKQNTVIGKFLFLENHPALTDCLYLPAEDENFEDLTRQVLREIFKGNPLFGKFITFKKSKTKKPKLAIDRSKPALFLDDLQSPEPSDPTKKKLLANKEFKKKKKTDKKAENNFILAKLK